MCVHISQINRINMNLQDFSCYSIPYMVFQMLAGDVLPAARCADTEKEPAFTKYKIHPT